MRIITFLLFTLLLTGIACATDTSTGEKEILSIVSILCWVVLGGALGGTMELLNRFKLDDKNKYVCYHGTPISFIQTVGLWFTSAMLGIGGAIAVQLGMMWIEKFPTDATVKSYFFLLSMSVVAGFSGRKFLGLLSSKLEEQIGEANYASQQANKISKEAKQEAEESILLIRALATLRKESPVSERLKAIEAIEKILESKPDDRMLTITLGRLYKSVKEYKSAINVLTKFIDIREGSKNFDIDYADALYNRACYKVLLATDHSTHNVNLLQSGLVDLRKSVEIAKGNAQDAENDPDFQAVRDNEEFKTIVS